MPTQHEVDGAKSSLSRLEDAYASTPEPNTELTHQPGKYTVELKGLTIRETEGKSGANAGVIFTFAELSTEVVQPANSAPQGELPNGRTEFGNELTWDGSLNSEGGMRWFKIMRNGLGVNTGTLAGDVAAINAMAGQFWEVTVKHKQDRFKNKTTGEDVEKTSQSVFFNKRVS